GRELRIHLVPRVVLRYAAAAVGARPRLLDGAGAVAVEADPEARVRGRRAAGRGGLCPVGGDGSVAAAGGGVARPVRARSLRDLVVRSEQRRGRCGRERGRGERGGEDQQPAEEDSVTHWRKPLSDR